MSSEQASRIVLLCGAGMGTFVLIQAAREGRAQEKTYKSLWAIGLVTLGLAVAADFVPQIAGPFAVLVLIAMAARNSGAIGSVIGGRTTTRSSSSRATPKSSGASGRGKRPAR